MPKNKVYVCDCTNDEITISSEGLSAPLTLTILKLTNRCQIQNGHGHADWKLEIVGGEDDDAILSGDGVKCPRKAISVLAENHGGENIWSGRINDDPEPARHQASLSIRVDPKHLQFSSEQSRLTLTFNLHCELFPDGAKAPSSKTLTWTLEYVFALRHIPDDRVLAIDFGTCAIAVAFAEGETIRTLPLAGKVVSPGSCVSQHLENSLYYLSADSTLAVYDNPASNDKYRPPKDGNYLVLPAEVGVDINPVYVRGETYFQSLKTLLMRGCERLPVMVNRYPYRTEKGKLEKKEQPPLDEVLRGVFKDIMDNYIKKVLDDQEESYNYLVVTHPNTYSAIERTAMKRILEVFVSEDKYHNLYRSNIHLLSESDAVLYYYVLNAEKLRGIGPEAVPNEEIVLIYDIGAGTLDLTLAHIKRPLTSRGALGKPEITILDRHGVEAAGNMLTECIARDLHEYLNTTHKVAYKYQIVQDELQAPAQRTAELTKQVLELRMEIERYKRCLAQPGNLGIQLHGGKTSRIKWLIDPDELAKPLDSELTTDGTGEYFWQPDKPGQHVKDFITQVTQFEVELFMHEKPIPNTVIVSGRTALWPGLLDRLKQTLPTVTTWIDFAQQPEVMKNAVSEGAVFSQTRWKNSAIIKSPAVFGNYVLRYEVSKNNWHDELLPHNKPVSVELDNTYKCYVGIQNGKRFKVLFDLIPKKLMAKDGKSLTFTMRPTDNGDFRCDIVTEANVTHMVTQENAAEWRIPRNVDFWPLTQMHLHKLTSSIAKPENTR